MKDRRILTMSLKVTFLLIVLLSMGLRAQPHFVERSTGSEASLRGISAVSNQICWVSGSGGQVFKTTDRGLSWQEVSPQGYENIEFRDIAAFSADSAYILAAASPGLILLTTDGGEQWQEVYRNEHPQIFYDAFDFFADGNGIAFGDAIGDRLQIVTGKGANWQGLTDSLLPRVANGQGGFAASGSCLQCWGDNTVAIVLGQASASVLVSYDRGNNWQQYSSPLDFGEASKGIFSLAIYSDSLWAISGGDYRADSLSHTTLAISYNGGRQWEIPPAKEIQGHYLSSVIFIDDKQILACSHKACFYSDCQGQSWQLIPQGFYSLSRASDGSVWASGKMGMVGYFIN